MSYRKSCVSLGIEYSIFKIIRRKVGVSLLELKYNAGRCVIFWISLLFGVQQIFFLFTKHPSKFCIYNYGVIFISTEACRTLPAAMSKMIKAYRCYHEHCPVPTARAASRDTLLKTWGALPTDPERSSRGSKLRWRQQAKLENIFWYPGTRNPTRSHKFLVEQIVVEISPKSCFNLPNYRKFIHN